MTDIKESAEAAAKPQPRMPDPRTPVKQAKISAVISLCGWPAEYPRVRLLAGLLIGIGAAAIVLALARLQSFDDEFVFPPLINPVSQVIGNAVPPLLMSAFGHHVATFFDSRSQEVATAKMTRGRCSKVVGNFG